jgi:hypothetical protein
MQIQYKDIGTYKTGYRRHDEVLQGTVSTAKDHPGCLKADGYAEAF